MSWRAATLLGLALLGLACATGADAATRALLIGVSSYPGLPAARQLQGPRNDVRRMRDVLLARGVDAAQIALVADGVPGALLPTRDNILQALARQVEAARPGDTLVLHFAGHGSRQPDTSGTGWTPILLPRDIGAWDGRAGRVQGAITADELRSWVDRIGARGSFVWGIFDTCHAAGVVRGGARAGAQLRQVPPDALGVPAADLVAAGPGSSALATPSGRGLSDRLAGGAGGRPARAAFFYATQGHEPTPELALPRNALWREQHGLFSHVVSRALERAGRVSYRQLGQFILAEYGVLAAATATPLFSGDGLDVQLLAATDWPVAQWPLRMGPGGPSVDAGALSGLLPGAVLALVASPLDSAGRPLGHLAVAQSEAARASLTPVAHGGLPAPAAAALVPGRHLRLVHQPPELVLRVAADVQACPAGCALDAALHRLRAQGAAGVALQWTEPAQLPDVLLRVQGDRVLLLPPAWQRADGTDAQVPAWVAWRHDGQALPDAALAQDIASALHKLGRARNLLALAARQASAPRSDGLVIRLRRLQGSLPLGLLPTEASVPVLQAGDRMALDLENTGPKALDVTVLYIDAQHGVQAMFPNARGPLNRIAPGARETIEGFTVSVPPAGLERFLVLARPAAPGAERTDFSFLAQPGVVRPRGAIDDDTALLLEAAFASHRSRNMPRPLAPAGALTMRLLSLEVRAAAR